MTNRKMILIVDDEDEIRENLHDFVEFKGFNVLEAANGQDALNQLDQHPDLILSDLMMPQVNGLQLLQKLAEQNVDIPVVIMTAFGTMEYAIEAMKNGAADFITKPIDLHYLTTVIERVIRRSEMEFKIKEQQRQLEEDLLHAATVQRSLLPGTIDNPHLSFHYRFEPLIAIGGDYLTVHQYSPKRIAIALYDVSGHGVSAALTASLAHNQLQMRMAEECEPAQIIEHLNHFVSYHIEKVSVFITMAVVLIDLDDRKIYISNAGHPDILIWKTQTNELKAISSQTIPIGLDPEHFGENNQTTFELESGDRVLIYTDGFPESCDKDKVLLGREGLKKLVSKHIHLSSEDLLNKMFEERKSYHYGDPEDDLTFVIVKIK